jgi:hypothetical protein
MTITSQIDRQKRPVEVVCVKERFCNNGWSFPNIDIVKYIIELNSELPKIDLTWNVPEFARTKKVPHIKLWYDPHDFIKKTKKKVTAEEFKILEERTSENVLRHIDNAKNYIESIDLYTLSDFSQSVLYTQKTKLENISSVLKSLIKKLKKIITKVSPDKKVYYSLCMRIYENKDIVLGAKISEDIYAQYFGVDIEQVEAYDEPVRLYW